MSESRQNSDGQDEPPNGNLNEMRIVGNNSPLISPFIIKKTSQFYKILS